MRDSMYYTPEKIVKGKTSEDIALEVEEFLSGGGVIENVPRGATGVPAHTKMGRKKNKEIYNRKMKAC